MPFNQLNVVPPEEAAIIAKRRLAGVQATNRWKAKRQETPPEQGFALVHRLLSTHGPMTKRDLGQRTKLFGPALDAALSHGLNQGHFTMQEQQSRPQMGGRTSQLWSLAPQQEEPEQLSRYDDTSPDPQPTNVPQHVQNIQDAARKPNFKHYLESYLGSLSGPEYAHTVRALGASPSHDEDPHGDIFRNLVTASPQNIQPTQTTASGVPLSPEKQELSQLDSVWHDTIGWKDPREVRLLTLSNGKKAVFKPQNGEPPHRFAIEPGTYYRREAAASAVADVLGMDDLVPPTTIRNHNGEIGSVQQFVDGHTAMRAPVGTEFDGHTDAARAAVFDYLIGNTDRHIGNWIISPEGKLKLIDNGLSFPNEHDAGDNDTNIDILQHARDNRLPMPDLSPIVGKWPHIEAELRHHGIEEEAIAHAKRRYEAVTSGRHYFVHQLPHPSTLV